MSLPPFFRRAFVALGMLCVVLLVWLWRGEDNPPSSSEAKVEKIGARTVATSSVPPPEVSAEAAARESAIRAMLTALQRALARGDTREGEAVLAFKDDAALRRFLERAAKSGLTVVGTLDALRAVRVRLDGLGALQADLLGNPDDYTDLAANPLIGIPQPPAKEDRANVTQVPFGNETLAFLGADGDRSAWGRGTTIAILDTGVSPDATFGSGRLRTLDIGLGTMPGSGRDDGHGTAIAALAAGFASDAAGVAPAADLLSIRVTDTSGMSDLFTVAKGIVAAVDSGARVINISLGGYAGGAVLASAIGYAAEHGALIVAAAGNDQAAQLAWPAADGRVVSVGAIDRAEQQVSFSNSGPQLQLTAPGYGVQTAWLNGQRVSMDGTSASSPLVAGAIAAVMSQNPNLTPQQAATLLVASASDGGAPGADAAYGHGILNLGWAMNRQNLSYVDTAVSSHYYDAASGQMNFLVQNRSGRPISGMSLNVNVGSATTTQTVPSLSPGETYVARVPVDAATLRASGTIRYTTQLVNPPGTVDRVPENNRRASTLSAPAR